MAFTFQWVQVTAGIWYQMLTGIRLPAVDHSDYRTMVLIGLGCLAALLVGLKLGHDRHSTAACDRTAWTGPRVGRTGRGLSDVGRHDRNHPGVRVGTARADARHPGPDLHPLRAPVPDLSALESAAHPAELDRPAARRRDRAGVHRILRGIPRADDDGRDGAHRRVRPAIRSPTGSCSARWGSRCCSPA